MKKILLFLLLISFTFTITTIKPDHDDDIPNIGFVSEQTLIQI